MIEEQVVSEAEYRQLRIEAEDQRRETFRAAAATRARAVAAEAKGRPKFDAAVAAAEADVAKAETPYFAAREALVEATSRRSAFITAQDRARFDAEREALQNQDPRWREFEWELRDLFDSLRAKGPTSSQRGILRRVLSGEAVPVYRTNTKALARVLGRITDALREVGELRLQDVFIDSQITRVRDGLRLDELENLE